ncbi:phage terminase large subunit family protein [Methylobacterium planeticum]|uniref:Phage terminase large subunit GpA ATPase domain-containing protein n=1 Tax=Methylobacterium planeticum TaxID=2615211 RepID=A0A6N6MC00_9HYPH|nr:phage terminase large subunit family protein [Methylobacterium planeticum]KAB1068140.1 hypothetical protein F6X51_27190 [Methylobacterium planeticum]
MSNLLDRTARAARARLVPPPRLPLSQWIERHVQLPPEVAARPGPVRLCPFQREIADAISDPILERVTVRKAARVGYTTLLTGATASYVANEPAPILTLLPTDYSCRTYIVSDLEPIFDASPVVAGILSIAADERRRARPPGSRLRSLRADPARRWRASGSARTDGWRTRRGRRHCADRDVPRADRGSVGALRVRRAMNEPASIKAKWRPARQPTVCPSALTQTDGSGDRLTAARMSVAGLVQTKGLARRLYGT